MAGPGLLFFHAPCFDGAVSAAITADFLVATDRWTRAIPKAVNYTQLAEWLDSTPSRPFAAVDFPFHPRAALWADHHSTAFATPQLRRKFAGKKSAMYVFDETAPSCAQLLWKHLKDAFGYRQARFKPMVEWATRIDAAGYRSVDEVFDATAPALMINLALSQFEATDCESLVRLLLTNDLDEVARYPKVNKAFVKARTLSAKGLKLFERSARLDGDIVVFDVDARNTIVHRYAPYRFFPNARYSAGIIRDKDRVKVTAMRNPWKNFRSAPLGKIFQHYGGGGHQRVGSVVLERADAAGADSVLAGVVSRIRQRDRAGD